MWQYNSEEQEVVEMRKMLHLEMKNRVPTSQLLLD